MWRRFVSVSAVVAALLAGVSVPASGNVTAELNVGALETTANRVSAGPTHACALTDTGGIQCWGGNTYGQTDVPPHLQTSGATQVTTGSAHTCALTDTGGIQCWGYNYGGDTNVPKELTSSGATQVTAGSRHTCALTDAGGIKCWGDDSEGQTDVPAELASSGATQVTAGVDFTCAVTDTGGVQCWGYNNLGQIDVPQDLSATGAVQVIAGTNYTCALTTTGGVTCWGYNYTGQTDVPADLASSGAKQVSAGEGHTCALTTTGGVTCWGYNYYGQADVPTNLQVSGATSVSLGSYYTCAVIVTGAIDCWGLNGNGQTDVPEDLTGATSVLAANYAPDNTGDCPVDECVRVQFFPRTAQQGQWIEIGTENLQALKAVPGLQLFAEQGPYVHGDVEIIYEDGREARTIPAEEFFDLTRTEKNGQLLRIYLNDTTRLEPGTGVTVDVALADQPPRAGESVTGVLDPVMITLTKAASGVATAADRVFSGNVNYKLSNILERELDREGYVEPRWGPDAPLKGNGYASMFNFSVSSDNAEAKELVMEQLLTANECKLGKNPQQDPKALAFGGASRGPDGTWSIYNREAEEIVYITGDTSNSLDDMYNLLQDSVSEAADWKIDQVAQNSEKSRVLVEQTKPLRQAASGILTGLQIYDWWKASDQGKDFTTCEARIETMNTLVDVLGAKAAQLSVEAVKTIGTAMNRYIEQLENDKLANLAAAEDDRECFVAEKTQGSPLIGNGWDAVPVGRELYVRPPDYRKVTEIWAPWSYSVTCNQGDRPQQDR